MGDIITLITDFGLHDGYVAAMKGVILGLNPEVTLVDICHTIQPQNIQQAAFVLSTIYDYFPSNTIHLVVVDPGVGTDRRPLILKTPEARFVAPDNGILSYIINLYPNQPLPDSRRVILSSELNAYVITRSEYWRKPVSNTFHGRDIFAPVAARLSLGLMPASLGDNVDTVTTFPIPLPFHEGSEIIGQILHIDNFGNLITNIQEKALFMSGPSAIIIRNQIIHGLVRTYAEGETLIALFGSSDYLEISLKNGNAATYLGVKPGDEVRIRP